ncbi:HK97 family phage prohead protease [Stappia stellulata]|uniref:HK97 family phage prohead protease n=1 Tax=Stappia stellulata TaxID=71235 RepID=UPI001CD1AF3E|nr:HK97 family phage prohead protease [Stappia stellulata]MCA1241382.1 HK97 family phage prohead protease [Stappia stellulata]
MSARPPLAGESVAVSGYASLFATPDDARDLVVRGAFRRSLSERGASGIRFLWQHDPAKPIGVWDRAFEDARGLRVEGRLLTRTAAGAEAAHLLAGGALDGLSIGFRTRSARRDPTTGVRRVFDIDLWEVSLVTFPLHPGARLDVPGTAAVSPLRAVRS